MRKHKLSIQTPTRRDLEDKVIEARKVEPLNTDNLSMLRHEVGRIKDALKSDTHERVRDRALRVAAHAIRIAEEGDANYSYPKGAAGVDFEIADCF